MGLRRSIGETGKLRAGNIKQIPLMPFQLENNTILWLFFWFSQIPEAKFIKYYGYLTVLRKTQEGILEFSTVLERNLPNNVRKRAQVQ